MSPLKIYKASAGSGKTYQLTLHFLFLLFRNPSAYQKILAVTFTNKAASEMKYRILERLYKISLLSPEDVSDDLNQLMKLTGYSAETVIRRSREILVKILNDYTRLSIGTIDKFFQGVIRAFTREMGLNAGYTLELDSDRVLSEAADRMFLSVQSDKKLFTWLLRLAESRIEASKNWNFRSDILNLGKELFTEKYQSAILGKATELSRENIDILLEKTKAMISQKEAQMKEICQEMLNQMRLNGYEAEDFAGKSRSQATYFEKALNQKAYDFSDARKNAMSDIHKWIGKNETDEGKIGLAENKLIPGLNNIYKLYIDYRTAKEVENYIYALGILGDLADKIREINNEKNIFLLSDASRFLRGLINDNPTPFIYEKTGTFIDNIMLDEFQDTSQFQWENFKPLINHTLSIAKQNTIVGDVKQSIYRWRNSDWKILAESVHESFPGFKIEKEVLNENWRSKREIIRFNNNIFSQATGVVANILRDTLAGVGSIDTEESGRLITLLEEAYGDVNQEIPDREHVEGGFVRGIKFSASDNEFKSEVLIALPDWIKQLQDNGYEAGEIAVLVRSNKEGELVANQLLEAQKLQEDGQYDFNFVSNESLFLFRNPSVNFIVSVLTYISDPGNEINNLNLKYFHCIINRSPEDVPEALLPGKSIEDELGSGFIEHLSEYRRLPLFELVDQLISHFDLSESASDIPYLQAFQELVLELIQKDIGSLHDFLEYWKEHGTKRSITVSDTQNAINILTIHKSKGLQFKAVIIPFCNWSIDGRSSGFSETVLWCETAHTSFNTVPVVPVKSTKKLFDTHFVKDYIEELILGYIDSLNLLYVAMTRAEEALVVGLPKDDSKGKIKRAGQLISHVMSSSPVAGSDSVTEPESSENGFTIGHLQARQAKSRAGSKYVLDEYPVNIRNDKIRLKMRNSEYLNSESGASKDQSAFGIIMHEIFGKIQTLEDVADAVVGYIREGMLTLSQGEEISAEIEKKISDPEISDWFSGKYEVLNEREIYSESKSYRPDRVLIREGSVIVIDYKFGEREEQAHVQQVVTYMNLLALLGYKNIEGYVWYVIKDNILKVSSI